MPDGRLSVNIPTVPWINRRVAAWVRNDTGLDINAIRALSDYWGHVRAQYVAFERVASPRVYLHEMPGGHLPTSRRKRFSWTEERWPEVARTDRCKPDVWRYRQRDSILQSRR